MTTEKPYDLWGDFLIFDSRNFRHYSKVGDPWDEEIVKYHKIRKDFFKRKDLGDFDSDLFNQMLEYQYNVGKIHFRVEDDQTILSVVSLILRLVSSNQDGFKDLISGFKYRAASNSIIDSSPNIIIYCKPEDLDVIGRIIFKNAQQFFLQNYSKFQLPRYSEAVNLGAEFQSRCPIYKTIGDSNFKIMVQEELGSYILEEYFDIEHNFARPIHSR